MTEQPYFYDCQGAYKGSQPCFYNPEEVPGVEILECNASVFASELNENLSDDWRAERCFRKLTLKRQSGWRQIELKIYGVEYEQRVELFPKTMEILRSIPGMSTAYFSFLSPNTRIKPHIGDTDAFFRVHLGIKIPASLPYCGIEVAGQKRSWTTGRCIVFNDVYCHSAWNDTGEERVVLIVDILRPEFINRMMYVNSGVRATLYHARTYEIFFPLIELMPRILTRLLHPAFRYVSFGYYIALQKSKQVLRCFWRSHE